MIITLIPVTVYYLYRTDADYPSVLKSISNL